MFLPTKSRIPIIVLPKTLLRSKIGNAPYFMINQGDGDQVVVSNTGLSPYKWHHLAASYQAATTTLTLYVDSVQAGVNTNVTALPFALTTNEAYLGYANAGVNNSFFSGRMDEVRILNAPGNCFSVQQQLDCELSVDDAALGLYYQFNQGTANINNTSITELIAAVGPNGTLENFALAGATSNFLYGGAVESGSLIGLECNENEGFDALNFIMEFDTQEGLEYLILVDGYAGTVGQFCLEVTNQGATAVTNITTTNLRIFPNPTTGWIQLPQIELALVEAYDATGRLVLSQQQPGTSIDLAAQPAGLYTLKLYTGKEVYSAKIIKK